MVGFEKISVSEKYQFRKNTRFGKIPVSERHPFRKDSRFEKGRFWKSTSEGKPLLQKYQVTYLKLQSSGFKTKTITKPLFRKTFGHFPHKNFTRPYNSSEPYYSPGYKIGLEFRFRTLLFTILFT